VTKNVSLHAGEFGLDRAEEAREGNSVFGSYISAA